VTSAPTAHDAEAAATALREAADAYDAHGCEESGAAAGLRLPCEHTLNTAGWLRERADEISGT
jgi:hypothetical protein